MAGKRKTAAKSRSGNTNRKRTNRSRRSAVKQKSGNSALIMIYEFFTGTYFGRVAVASVLIILILLIDLLIANNKFDLFFALVGIELIISAIAAWLYFLLNDETAH